MANHSVICYPTSGKQKAVNICSAFALGCKGYVPPRLPDTLLHGDAFFYGVTDSTENLWKQAQREHRDWFYCDNSYFDQSRGKHYRVTRNALQAWELAIADPVRLQALGVAVAPWRTAGAHIVVCEQSDQFMRLCGYGDNWLVDVVRTLKEVTDRELRIRFWQRDKRKAANTLHEDLKGAWALVTHMSAAANEALLAGIPVFVSGECAALPMAGTLPDIENPKFPDNREEWAAGLAANQWTLDEMSSGKCWRDLNDRP